ncbi:MAG: prolipoprotein diacylglyceryl transferase [candidate division KSB1 bacterium]|nr:prolipoprotein diacylglyceryl transferase [candidate division KSB1 bacterium]MDZ7273606.1 prolipoprotein diacylglyceryl transferase [candidate division KSB1 bacterium]MDZ7286803.1 prolipoprotein diacylglyceryl transferase [candidate division KSB1 bacterium]MDZ7299840.1 prolipoprotein diacylglyceryl transferase [candidate division KSB1 bacterium]MDZ7307753.1 prolipoprotein diacylglyceryl transferase [candidate division KSB1 bacterium]
MFPELFKLGPLTIHSFGVMAALGFLVGGYLLEKEFVRVKLPKDDAGLLVLAAFLGGMIGAKLYFLIEHPYLLKEDFWGNVFSGAGLVWYGGFLGGLVAGVALSWRRKLPVLQVADLFAPVLALGQAFGRMGCFLSGDGDYGPPSDLPWAMRFSNGVVPTRNNPELQNLYAQMHPGAPIPADIAVHPTMLYDLLILLVSFAILWRLRRRPWPSGRHFALYLVLIGSGRFFTEFWRMTPKHHFGLLSDAQLISLLLILAGVVVLLVRRGQPAFKSPA